MQNPNSFESSMIEDDPIYNASLYLDLDEVDIEVSKLLKKYNISTCTTYLYHLNDDYHALIEYTSELIFKKEKIPEDIQNQLNENYSLKKYLLVALRDKLDNISTNNSTIVFKELVIMLQLLSFNQNFNIFENYNTYNMTELGKLFRAYEEKILYSKLNEDEKEFLLLFEQYLLVLDALIELCTINSSDIKRKKTINPITDTITESLNLLKYNVKLEDTYISILNNFQGKMLFSYSHVPYTNIKNKDAKYLIDEFTFTLEKISDGYMLSKDTNFGSTSNEKKYYKTFLNSSNSLICNLLYKLKTNYKQEEYEDIQNFQNLFELYEDIITHCEVPKFSSLQEFQAHLLNNYLYLYDETLSTNDECIIDRFLDNPDFNTNNMTIIHSIVLYSCRIDEKRLLKMIYNLISIDKFENDYHEFYKLNICDVIINRLTNSQNLVMNLDLINMIVQYIEENKTASHLISSYTKIYLSLSLYLSYMKKDDELIEKSKLYYSYYVNINGRELLENEYSKIEEQIKLNHGIKYFLNFDLEKDTFSDEKFIEIGNKVLDKFFIREEINSKFKINQALSNIVTDIFNNDGMDDDLLNSYIEKFISRDIFFGMIFCSIDGLCERKCRLIDLGYEIIKIPLLKQYQLKIAYSTVYKDNFERIFSANKEYIQQNVKNLIISYIKSTPLYLDIVTKLPNIEKLKTDLEQEDEDLVFVEIYIHNLFDLNSKYDYNMTNEMFKEYCNEIENYVNLYRLYGPKIGFYLEDTDDYQSLIEKIQKITIKHPKEEIKSDLTVAVSHGNKENILAKASHCMSTALKSNKRYNEFK